MSLVIRKAEISDLRQVEELWVQLSDHVNSLDRRHWQHAADGSAKFRQWMEEALTDAERVVFVAEQSGTVLGFGHSMLKKSPPPVKPRLDGFITDLVVTESVRRQGVGTKLLKAVESWCIEHGAEAITLSVAARNELGLAFWCSKGFEPWTSTMWKPLGQCPNKTT